MNTKLQASAVCAFFLIFFQFVISNEGYSQVSWWKNKNYSSEAKRQKFADCKKVFLDIADGINYESVYLIIPYFGSEVYLNFVDNEKGYYSPDQARFIIESFLTNYPATSFKWKVSNASDNYAFALGKHKYKKNGSIYKFDVSASLKYVYGKWLIDQLIVN